jgi:beta-lactamase regulating signal transducer with metallopeptidase domain
MIKINGVKFICLIINIIIVFNFIQRGNNDLINGNKFLSKKDFYNNSFPCDNNNEKNDLDKLKELENKLEDLRIQNKILIILIIIILLFIIIICLYIFIELYNKFKNERQSKFYDILRLRLIFKDKLNKKNNLINKNLGINNNSQIIQK